MYKNFVASLFSIACFSINSLSVNAGETYSCSDDPYSYSHYNFDTLGHYILVNTTNHKDIQNTTSNANETLENLSNEANIENNVDTNDIIKVPQERELWLKTYSEDAVIYRQTDKCVSLTDVLAGAYKITFDNITNVNNVGDTDTISKLKNKLAKIFLQLKKNNTQIFIPDLVIAINKVNKTSEIQPLAYIDDILSSYDSTDNLIIYFHIAQLAKHSDNRVTDTYNTEDETSKTSTQNIIRDTVLYRINLQNMGNTLILHTTDRKSVRIP